MIASNGSGFCGAAARQRRAHRAGLSLRHHRPIGDGRRDSRRSSRSARGRCGGIPRASSPLPGSRDPPSRALWAASLTPQGALDERRRQKRQPACKPGSVWPGFWPRRDDHSSGTPVAGRLKQPTRATRPTDRPRGRTRAHRSYSVLLPAGLAMPPTLPPARCALTAPFHPCPDGPHRPASGGLLSVALSLGSPPPDVIRRRIRMEPGLSSALEKRRPSGRLARTGI